MKLTILKEKIKKGVSISERACSKSITLPVLQQILFSAEKNFLKITGTDLEIAIQWWGLAKVEKEGKVLLPTKIILNFLSYLPEKPILIEKRENFILLKCDSFSSMVKSFSPEDFPIIPEIKPVLVLKIESEKLIKNLRKIVSFVAQTSTRPEISGVYFIFGKSFLKMVATDSFRLGEITLPFSPEKPIEKEISFILPQRASREIINTFSEVNKEIKIYINPNQLALETEMEETPHPEISFISRLIEGEFPDYQSIIPKKFELETVFPKDEFIKQLKMASIFSPKNNEIKFKFNPEKQELEIRSENPEFGSYNSFLKGKIKGKPLTISFNYRFLLEGIEKVEGKEFSFQMTNEEGPALIKAAGEGEFIYVLMPIKVA